MSNVQENCQKCCGKRQNDFYEKKKINVVTHVKAVYVKCQAEMFLTFMSNMTVNVSSFL